MFKAGRGRGRVLWIEHICSKYATVLTCFSFTNKALKTPQKVRPKTQSLLSVIEAFFFTSLEVSVTAGQWMSGLSIKASGQL